MLDARGTYKEGLRKEWTKPGLLGNGHLVVIGFEGAHPQATPT